MTVIFSFYSQFEQKQLKYIKLCFYLRTNTLDQFNETSFITLNVFKQLDDIFIYFNSNVLNKSTEGHSY